MKKELKQNGSRMNPKIEEFILKFNEGKLAWEMAGKILVELLDEDPYAYDYIIQAMPTMTPAVLNKFEAMGRGLILPALVMDNSAGARQLVKLPISMQERFIYEPVPVVTQTEAGWDLLLVRTPELTPNQAKQVFRNGRYATEGEQRAWIEDFKLKTRAGKMEEAQPGYELVNGCLVVGKIKFTPKQLAQFLAQLTK